MGRRKAAITSAAARSARPHEQLQPGALVWMEGTARTSQLIVDLCDPPQPSTPRKRPVTCPRWPGRVVKCQSAGKTRVRLLGFEDDDNSAAAFEQHLGSAPFEVDVPADKLTPLRTSVHTYGQNRERGLHASNQKVAQRFKEALRSAANGDGIARDSDDSDSELLPATAALERHTRKPTADETSMSSLTSLTSASSDENVFMATDSPSKPPKSAGANGWLRKKADTPSTPVAVGSVVLVKYKETGSYYHPALMESVCTTHSGSTLYLVRSWDGSSSRVPRKSILADTDPLFESAEVAREVFEYANINEEHSNPQLCADINAMLPELDAICVGNDADCWRYTEFVGGGKSAQSLHKKVARGPFSPDDYHLIARQLQSAYNTADDDVGHTGRLAGHRLAFLPDNNSADSDALARKLSLTKFIELVLVPETVVRLLMRRGDSGGGAVSREQAERDMMEAIETDWVLAFISRRSRPLND